MLKSFKKRADFYILQGVGLSLFEHVINFIRNILLVRFIGADFYGRYQYILAALFLVDIGSVGLDSILRRFFHSANNRQKLKIFRANILVKTISFSFIGSVVIFYLSRSTNKIFHDNLSLILYLLFYFFLNSILGALVAVAQGLGHYNESNSNSFFVSIFSFILFLFGFYFLDLTVYNFFLFYLAIGLIQTILLIFLYLKLIKSSFGLIVFFKISIGFKETILEGVWSYRSYILPQYMSYVSGYFINNVPALMLGSAHQFDTIAYLELIKKMFRLVHKMVPKVVKSMVKIIVAKQEADDFSEKWKRYVLSYMLATFAIGIIMFVFSFQIITIYGFEFNNVIKNIFFLFSFFLTFGAWGQSIDFLIFADKSTYSSFITGFIRQLYVVSAYLYIGHSANAFNLSFILVSSMAFQMIYLVGWIFVKHPKLRGLQSICALIILLQIVVMDFMAKNDLYLKLNLVKYFR
jgi:O-antigen/teichoic acid export membrane protein